MLPGGGHCRGSSILSTIRPLLGRSTVSGLLMLLEMMQTKRISTGAAVVFAVALSWVESPALTIYRFGGEELPPPPEAEFDRVLFVPRSWVDPVDEDLGGEVYQVDLGNRTLKALQYDPGINMAPTAKERGEGIRVSTRQADHEKAVDGDLSTAWFPAQYLCANYDPNQVGSRRCPANSDYLAPPPPYFLGGGRRFIAGGYGLGGWTFGLGGLFLIDKVRIVSGLEDESGIMKNFKLLAASGRTADPRGSIQYFNEIVEIRGNQRKVLDIEFPPGQRFDFLSILHAEHNTPWAVHEVEVFARGFVERASYVSEVMEFDRDMAWGELSWSGNRDPGAEMRIHTRSGNTADQNLYWRFTGLGGTVQVEDANTYNRLALGERAGTTYDRDNWTFWSAPYDLADSSGTPVVSLGPRRFLQFKVDMLPGEESGSELRVLEFRASEPLAARLVGEVYPTQAQVAEPTSFTYYLRPSISGDNSGFDGLEMTTTSIVNGVSRVRIGEQEWPFTVTPLDYEGSELAGFPAHRFELTLVDTKLVSRASSTPVEIDFEARVLRSGSAFDLRVFDSARPLEVRQSVAEGDANNLIEGDRVSVATTANASSLLQAEVSPAVFTPNGDRINDAVSISYDLLEIIGLASVTIDITDLSGRVVRRLYEGEDAIGNYQREWDGRDESGEMVPPGIYLYFILADTDRGRVAELGSVNIAR